MSWLITGTYKGAAVSDADAQAYLRAVEQADNQGPLEQGVQQAVNQFVIGCKNDGIWPAIKASCILAGARTLTGALVPLVGAAPTNVDGLFVSDDYNRKTGLVGDGSTKYLDSNRNNNADPQDSKHLACFVSTAGTSTGTYVGAGGTATGASFLGRASISLATRLNSASGTLAGAATITGFYAINRSNSADITGRVSGATETIALASATPVNGNLFVLNRTTSMLFSDARLAFYSIGESLDLALLDARVTTMINAFDAAI
jgi:hypothetical protein